VQVGTKSTLKEKARITHVEGSMGSSALMNTTALFATDDGLASGKNLPLMTFGLGGGSACEEVDSGGRGGALINPTAVGSGFDFGVAGGIGGGIGVAIHGKLSGQTFKP